MECRIAEVPEGKKKEGNKEIRQILELCHPAINLHCRNMCDARPTHSTASFGADSSRVSAKPSSRGGDLRRSVRWLSSLQIGVLVVSVLEGRASAQTPATGSAPPDDTPSIRVGT